MSEGFNNPLVGGGGSLVYPSIHSPNFVTGIAGWSINKDGSAEFNNVVIRNGQVVSGTALYYNGAPALGTLIASLSATGGTDVFGNVYPAGFNFGTWNVSGALKGHFGIGPSGTTFLANTNGLAVVIGHTSDGSLLFYDANGESLNHLVGSIAPAAGTDPSGNAYLQGLTNYIPNSFFAQLLSGQIILGSKNPNTRLLNTTTLTIADALTDASSPFISLVSPGVQGTAQNALFQLNSQSKDLSQPTKALISGGALSNPCPLEVDGPISFGLDGTHLAQMTTDANGLIVLPGAFSVKEQAAPAQPPANFGMIYANSTDKFLHYKDENGSDFTLDGGQGDTTQFTVTQATSTQLSKIWSIASGAPLGSVWRMKIGGHAVWGSTQQQLTLIMSLAGTNVLQKNIAAAAFAASTALDWDVEMWLQITGTGGSGSARGILKGNLTPSGSAVTAGNSATFTARQVSIAISTLVANNFGLNALWAATTGAPTITSDGSHYERIGP
jgi:hypothetical protein